MSHNVEHMIYTGETPWHNTNCIEIKDPRILKNPRKFMELAIPFEVYVDDLYMKVPNTKKLMKSKIKVLRRDDTHDELTTMGKGWHPIYNRDIREFIHEFRLAVRRLGLGDMTMETGGVLQKGAMVWALARTHHDFDVVKGDTVEDFLFFANPHKFGYGARVMDTSVRVVCNNTYNQALGEAGEVHVSIQHRKKFDIEKVRDIVLAARLKTNKFKEAAKVLAKRKVQNQAVLDKFFGDLFPKAANSPSENALSRTAQQVKDLMETQPGSKFARGSWWQAFNAVTFAEDHFLGRERDTALTNAWFGAGARVKEKALESALELSAA